MVVNPKSLTHPPLIISFQFQLTPHASCPHPNPQSLCHSCSHAQEHAGTHKSTPRPHTQSHTSHSHSLTLKHCLPSSLPLTADPSSLHRWSRPQLSPPVCSLLLFKFFFFVKYFIITFLVNPKTNENP